MNFNKATYTTSNSSIQAPILLTLHWESCSAEKQCIQQPVHVHVSPVVAFAHPIRLASMTLRCWKNDSLPAVPPLRRMSNVAEVSAVGLQVNDSMAIPRWAALVVIDVWQAVQTFVLRPLTTRSKSFSEAPGPWTALQRSRLAAAAKPKAVPVMRRITNFIFNREGGIIQNLVEYGNVRGMSLYSGHRIYADLGYEHAPKSVCARLLL